MFTYVYSHLLLDEFWERDNWCVSNSNRWCSDSFGSHLGTPALKTENVSVKKKSVVLVKRENGFTETLFSLFFQGFLCRGMVLVNTFLRFSSASKCHFQSVIFRWGISRAPGSSLGTSPCTRAKVTLVHRSHTQQNKGKQVSFSWKAPWNAPEGNRVPLLFCKGSTPGTQQKMTPRKWHLDSLEFHSFKTTEIFLH